MNIMGQDRKLLGLPSHGACLQYSDSFSIDQIGFFQHSLFSHHLRMVRMTGKFRTFKTSWCEETRLAPHIHHIQGNAWLLLSLSAQTGWMETP